MRLLNAKTKQFEEFFGDIPPYAILSHTWGPNELSFKDMERNGYTASRKTDGCCRQAVEDGLDYVWIDTCCIDKSSSAELSEAINSMWAWYGQAKVCYAYLSDVLLEIDVEEAGSAFSRSRWFTRGWTLQELLSPRIVVFYDEAWNRIGRKSGSGRDRNFTSHLSRVTGVPVYRLTEVSRLRAASVAQKMSWAAGRTTTRTEDMAYSLLGLFGINMPLLYGEGTQAFVRLQEEILKASDDESIFAWISHEIHRDRTSLFASSPAEYADCDQMIPSIPLGLQPSHYTLTNKGLLIETSLCDFPFQGGVVLALLNCSDTMWGVVGKNLALVLVRSSENGMILSRQCRATPVLVSSSLFSGPRNPVYVHRSLGHEEEEIFSGLNIKYWLKREDDDIQEFYPPAWRGIMAHRTFIWVQRKYVQLQRQSIFFLIENDHGPNYAVWLEYEFSNSSHTKSLRPRALSCRAACIEKGTTLAEKIIQDSHGTEVGLDWQEVLELGDSELIFELDKGVGEDRLWTVTIMVDKKQSLR